MLHIFPEGVAFIYSIGCYQTRHDREGSPKYPTFYTFGGSVTVGGELLASVQKFLMMYARRRKVE